MNIQEACEFAVTKIVAQGGRCIIGNEADYCCACAYANGDRHCAVGWLFVGNYEHLMDSNMSLRTLVTRGELDSFFIENVETLSLLQSFHDASLKHERERFLKFLSDKIDVSNPVFQKWVEMVE
jgi:hypothetical protein